MTWLVFVLVSMADGRPTGLDSISPFAERRAPALASDALVVGAGALSVGVAAVPMLKRREWAPLAGTAAALAVTAGVTAATKHWVDRRRPYTWDETRLDASRHDYCASVRTPNDCNAFFSGHTSMTAVSAFAAVESLRRQGKLERRLGVAYGLAGAYTVAAGGLRVAAGKHHISDVAVGAAVGALGGTLVPRWFGP